MAFTEGKSFFTSYLFCHDDIKPALVAYMYYMLYECKFYYFTTLLYCFWHNSEQTNMTGPTGHQKNKSGYFTLE